MRAADLAEKFGISKSTAGNKSGEICKLMKIGTFEPEWTLPSKLGDNPFVWMFEAPNGFIFDARYAPIEIQKKLFDTGQIPFIPAEKKPAVQSPEEYEGSSEAGKADSPKKKREQAVLEGQITFDDELKKK